MPHPPGTAIMTTPSFSRAAALLALLITASCSNSEPDIAQDYPERPDERIFLDATEPIDTFAEQWIERLRFDYDVDDAAQWQPTDVACSGRILLAGQTDHADTELFAIIQFDPRDSSALLYHPVTTTTAFDGSFTLQFKQALPTRAKWSSNHNSNHAGIILASPAMAPPRLTLYMRHAGYDGLVLQVPFEQHEATQTLGTVELLPAGSAAALKAASFGNKQHPRLGLFDAKTCFPSNIMREYNADPTLATCDDAMYHYLTSIRRSGWGRTRNTNEEFHEGFLLFRQHFMDGKDNTGQLMTWGVDDNQDASWHDTFIKNEAEFYDIYFYKMFREDPDAAVDLISKNKQLLPLMLPRVLWYLNQHKASDSPAFERIHYTLLADPAYRFKVLPRTTGWRDRRAVSMLIAMLKEKPSLDDQQRGQVQWNLASILELDSQASRDRDWLAWWQAEGQHIDWPEPPEPIEFETHTP